MHDLICLCNECSREFRLENLKAEKGKLELFIRVLNPRQYSPEREYVWSRPITPTTARVDNVPCESDACSRGDVVEHQGGEIVGVVERVAWTFRSHYVPKDGGSSDLEQRRIKSYFERRGISVEFWGDSLDMFLVLAVPCRIDPPALMGIVEHCPIELDGVWAPKEYGRFQRHEDDHPPFFPTAE